MNLRDQIRKVQIEASIGGVPDGDKGDIVVDDSIWTVKPEVLSSSLQDDETPTLGGDLDLNGFQFVGEMESSEFVIDGGLL